MAAAASRSYSISQKAIHWLMALLILFNLIFSDNIEAWNRAMNKGTVTPDLVAGANIHAYVGIAILVLAVIRLVMRLVQGAPEAPAEEPALFQLASKIAHGGLYLLFFLMPISGMLKYYGDVDIAGFLHAGPMKALLWVLIAGHVLALPVHQFIWKTNVASRMTKG